MGIAMPEDQATNDRISEDVLQSEVVQKHIGRLQAEYDRKIAELTKKLEAGSDAAKVLAGATEEFENIKKELDAYKQRESLVAAARKFYADFKEFGVELGDLLEKSSVQDMLDHCTAQAKEFAKAAKQAPPVRAGTGEAGGKVPLPDVNPHEAFAIAFEEAERTGKGISVTVNPFRR